MSLDDLGPHATVCESIELEFDGHGIEAWHARPEGMPIGGLVVIPDVFGLRPLFCDHAERLASWGLAVIVVEPFFTVSDEERSTDLAVRMAQVQYFEDDLILGALERGADWLVVHDDVATVSLIGFCMGGMYAMKASATGRFDHTIAIYGMPRVPDHWQSASQRDPVDLIEGAAEPSPLLAVFGADDALIPPAWVDDLRGALARVSRSEVVVYEHAEHGFVHDPSRPTHRVDDARDVWRRVFAVLGVVREPKL